MVFLCGWPSLPLLSSQGSIEKALKPLLIQFPAMAAVKSCPHLALDGHFLKEQKGWTSKVIAFCYYVYENLLTWFTNTGAHRWKGQAIVCKKSLLMNPGFSSPLNLMLSLRKLLNFFFSPL